MKKTVYFDKNGNKIKEGCIVEYIFANDCIIKTMIRRNSDKKLIFSQPKKEKMCSCGGTGIRRCNACNYRNSYCVVETKGRDTSNRSYGYVNENTCNNMKIISMNTKRLIDWIVL